MPMQDERTLEFYDRKAREYADMAAAEAEDDLWLSRFVEQLPKGARVLDFGCGSGWASGAMIATGLDVHALDASTGLAAEAWQRHDVPVQIAAFDELDAVSQYDGIWASFSLLHEPRTAMPGHLARLMRALKRGGLLYLSLKDGEGEGRDGLGRFYSYYSAVEIANLLIAAGFEDIRCESAEGPSFEGVVETLIVTFARKPG